jgi:streptomycin 6-kinase
MRAIPIPPLLTQAVDDDGPNRWEWLAALPRVVDEVASEWELELGSPFVPGGQCAWVAPARAADDEDLVLKVEWRHPEAEHEADALRLWAGNGAIRCFASRSMADTTALLLERCVPGAQLKHCVEEPEQDEVVARLMLRLWALVPDEGHSFLPLQDICDQWAASAEASSQLGGGADGGLIRDGAAMLRELPRTAERTVLLCTDLHAENVLSAQREPWLVIDPKPFIGDPAFDPVQHMLNCEQRLASDPRGLASRMAELCELDPERVGLWLFARCAQESRSNPMLGAVARRLAP